MAVASRRVRKYELDPEELERMVADKFGDQSLEDLSESLNESIVDIRPGQIVQAKVDSVDERTGLVIMDVGGKAEGQISLNEFGETLPVTGESFEVYFEGLDENDMSVLSKRRADRLRAWEHVSQKYEEGDEVQG
ncbi:MAG: hypothetical protein VXZ39_04010, partial [Planctomycetota bacterium]|nr:hypothetical protein [Planctomycetota bacterium]